MMIAAVKAFVKKDELNKDNTEMFKDQFQLSDAKIDELEEMEKSELRQLYKFSSEDTDELKTDFKSLGQEEFKNRFVEKLRVTLKLAEDDTKISELKKRFTETEREAIRGKFSGLGREAFIEKYKLTDIERSGVDELIDFFKKQTVAFSEAKSQIVVFMSHGDNGKITGKLFHIVVIF